MSARQSDKVKELQRYFEKNFPLYRHAGIKILEARHGEAKCYAPLKESNSNHFGGLHAAIQWAMAEVLGGVIIFYDFRTEEVFGLVKDFYIAFKQQATTDITSETSISPHEIDRVKDELDNIGKSELALEIELKNSYHVHCSK